MARANSARGSARGGGSIQTSSQILARVGTGLASVLGAAGIGITVAVTADANRLDLGVVALASAVLLALAVAGPLSWLLPWSLVLLAGGYAAKLGSGSIDQWAPVYAGSLFAVAELAYWSIELRGRAQGMQQLTERRAALVVTLALVAVGAGALVLAATSLRVGSGLATDVLGVAAAVAAFAVVAALGRSRA